MAVTTVKGVTTITPTAWKWWVGAGAGLIFVPAPFNLLLAVFFGLMASGKLQRVVLTPDGISLRNWWQKKVYRWEDIGDFRVTKLKSGLITAATMVSFTHRNKEGTMLGKAAKLLAGGTHSVPTLGMKAKDMALLMTQYKAGYVPEDTAVAAVAATPAMAAAVPAMAAAPARVSAAPQRPALAPAMPCAPRKGFGQKGVKAPARVAKVSAKQSPLVQDSRWRRRQTKSSPFG